MTLIQIFTCPSFLDAYNSINNEKNRDSSSDPPAIDFLSNEGPAQRGGMEYSILGRYDQKKIRADACRDPGRQNDVRYLLRRLSWQERQRGRGAWHEFRSKTSQFS